MQIVSKGNMYKSTNDPKFTSTDLHSVEARDFVFSDEVKESVRNDVGELGTFTSAATLDGAVGRALEVLHRFETRRRQHTPTDYFGIDVLLTEAED